MSNKYNIPNNIRTSFESSDTKKMETNKGLKLKPKKERIPKADQQALLDKKAKESVQKLEGHLQEALELGQEYLRILKLKKVPSEKGPMELSLEKEVGRKWQNYILRVNNDEAQPEGMGSASALSLVLSAMLKLRDRLNIIEHENYLLKTRISKLEKSASSRREDSNEK